MNISEEHNYPSTPIKETQEALRTMSISVVHNFPSTSIKEPQEALQTMKISEIHNYSSTPIKETQEAYIDAQIEDNFDSYFFPFTESEILCDKYDEIGLLTASETCNQYSQSLPEELYNYHNYQQQQRMHQQQQPQGTIAEESLMCMYIPKDCIDRTFHQNQNCMKDLFYRCIDTPDKYIYVVGANGNAYPNMLQCGNEQWKHIVVPSVECIGPEITNTIMRMNSLYRKQWYDIAGYILKASPNINVTLPENVFICAYGYSYTYRIYITKAKAEELFPDAYDCRSYDDYNCTCIGMYKVCWECYTNQTYSTFLQNTIYKFTKNAYLPLVTHETCSNTFDSFARFTYVLGRGYKADGTQDYTEANTFCNFCDKCLIGDIEIVHDITHKTLGCNRDSNIKMIYADNEIMWRIKY